VVPELWPDACDAISGMIDGYSTALITFAPRESMRWTSSPHIAEHMHVYEKSGLAVRGTRPQIALRIAPGTFMRDIDFLSPEDLAACPIRNEMLEPIGMAWEMGAVFVEPSGSTFVFSQLRRTEDGPFDLRAVKAMNAVKPDLARAAFLSARLGLRHASTIAETLSVVGLPGAVLGDRGNVLAANAQFEALAPRIQTGRFDRILLSNRQAATLLGEAMEHVARERQAAVQSIPVPASEDADDEHQAALILHVIPVRRNARDVLTRSAVILVATPVGDVGPPDLRVISGLFDLTRVEAQVAGRLASGKTIDGVAAELGIGRETVRTHLRAVFRKTGTNRQAQLVRLLSGLGNPVPTAEG